MDRSRVISYLRLHLASGVGAVRFRKLLDAFGTVDRVARATVSELAGVDGIGRATARQIYEGLTTVDPAGELERAERAGAKIVTFDDPDYPELIRYGPSPPALLYVMGELRRDDQLSIAIVGTRRAGRYGSEQAYRFGSLLAQAGFTVVSGLARGIDSQAHRGAIQAGGRTIAVIGAGLLNLYPPEHRSLAEKIAAGRGAVISELPMEILPDGKNFPTRNRIVAAMTLGTLVIEAPRRSGALITARYANEFNREAFAIPGPIDVPGFAGSNEYIKSGKAKLVSSLDDILEELGHAGEMMRSQVKQANSPNAPDEINVTAAQADHLSAPERTVWEFLDAGPNDIDTICQFCSLPPADASAALTMLQLKGMVNQLPGNQFSRK